MCVGVSVCGGGGCVWGGGGGECVCTNSALSPAGVIDSDYRGNLGVVLFNLSKTPYNGRPCPPPLTSLLHAYINLSVQIQVKAKLIFVFWGCWSRHSDFPGYERDVTRISLRIALRTLDLHIHALNLLPSLLPPNKSGTPVRTY